MKDLIRRSDAIKAVGNYFELINYSRRYAKSILNKVPSADRPQEWIPCSERLPMYNVDVLVYRPTMGQKIIVDTYCGYYGDDIDDIDEWYEGWGISREHPVTAWMPLPKPWKGADDGEDIQSADE